MSLSFKCVWIQVFKQNPNTRKPSFFTVFNKIILINRATKSKPSHMTVFHRPISHPYFFLKINGKLSDGRQYCENIHNLYLCNLAYMCTNIHHSIEAHMLHSSRKDWLRRTDLRRGHSHRPKTAGNIYIQSHESFQPGSTMHYFYRG